MKFISISMVKDEADIIELFIRINSRVIDHFFIIDNGSTDQTLQILERLKREGIPMTVYIDKTEYQQSAMTTKLLRTAAAQTQFDWAFILDADEFVNIERHKLEEDLATVPRTSTATLNWSHWIPRGDIYYNYSNPLWSAFDRKIEEKEIFPKVIIPYHMSKVCIVDTGNHHASINYRETHSSFDLQRVPEHLLSCGTLDHVPVRSSQQIIAKALCGSTTLSLKENRSPWEGYHWDNIANMIKQNNFVIDNILLRYIALVYMSNKGGYVEDVVETGAHLGQETDIIQYRYLSNVNQNRVFYNYIVGLSNQIRSGRAPKGLPGGPR